MNELKVMVDEQINDHVTNKKSTKCPSCHYPEHSINIGDVVTAVNKLKHGKHDGSTGHFSDHIIKGSRRLHILLSLFFNSLLSHGYVPEQFLIATVIPIPKSKKNL